MSENRNENPKPIEIFAMATDPIYIGTGGYTIGRVDNTIVRDPITNIPKIPGSSIAGTWRYYVALEAHNYFINDEIKIDKSKRKEKLEEFLSLKNKTKWEELLKEEKNEFIKQIFHEASPQWVKEFEGNRFIGIKCAGQDDASQKTLEESQNINTGHCGHCIVCKGFGFSKKDISWQGQIFFSDLNILFFPVFTRFGVKWITSERILKENEMLKDDFEEKEVVYISKQEDDISNFINLGWLNLPNEKKTIKIDLNDEIKKYFDEKDIIIVPDSLISQIINSNLEVRTSVSIDPITGAAKEGALFTSEAIPRGTIFYGNIRIFDKSAFAQSEEKLQPLPSIEELQNALEDSKHYYESLGIGGMTTRGFGRLKIKLV